MFRLATVFFQSTFQWVLVFRSILFGLSFVFVVQANQCYKIDPNYLHIEKLSDERMNESLQSFNIVI